MQQTPRCGRTSQGKKQKRANRSKTAESTFARQLLTRGAADQTERADLSNHSFPILDLGGPEGIRPSVRFAISAKSVALFVRTQIETTNFDFLIESICSLSNSSLVSARTALLFQC